MVRVLRVAKEPVGEDGVPWSCLLTFRKNLLMEDSVQCLAKTINIVQNSEGLALDTSDIMSWDSYIDNLLAQTKDASGTANCDKACIIGIDGGAPWTTAGHASALKLQGAEAANIAKCFKSKDFSSFMASGVHVEGVKYQFLREEDKKLALAKKKGEGSLTMQSSKTAVVIGHCQEGGQQGNLNKGVAVIAEYLESLGM